MFTPRVLGLTAAAALAAAAHATWSIIIIDTRTGEVAVASATCLTGFDLQANPPVLIPGVGAATAQSFVDATGLNRTLIRDGLLDGLPLPQILAGLAASDSGHQTRQYGIASTRGDTLTFSGTGAGAWAGGRTGRTGDLVWAVQGNVLTGAPVVDRAVEAIENTPGDLAEKLMASMEAARLMGGDGRCSCQVNNPTGCGAPPPQFTKSAHIAYMLIARAGDAQNCRAAYRAGASPQNVILADIDNDGRPDAVVANGSGNAGLTLVRNTTQPGGPARFALPAAVPPSSGPGRDLLRADLNDDGLPDLAFTRNANSQVAVLLARPDGTFGNTLYVTAAGPTALTSADFDGDGLPDLAAACGSANTVTVLFNTGDGRFNRSARLDVDPGPVWLAAADLDLDGDADLLVAHGSGRAVTALINTGVGAFTRQTLVSLPQPLTHVLPLAIPGESRPSFATVSVNEPVVRVYIGRDAGYESVSLPAASGPAQLAVADADRDGTNDLFVLMRSAQAVGVFRGLPDGGFEPMRTFRLGFSPLQFALGDVDGDGDVDAVCTVSGSGTVLVMSNLAAPGAIDFGEAGCASGETFMEFNIANTRAQDPDPVLTLREQFDQWRAGLVGVPDAVRSSVSPRLAYLPADGVSTATLTARLVDWGDRPVDAPATLMAIDRATPGLVTERVRALGAGVYEIDLTATGDCRTGSVEVLVDGFARRVVLMPAVEVQVGPAADFNMDGFVDFFDADAFLAAWEAGDPRADRDGDGTLSAVDVRVFIDQFDLGC
ncbi:MAG: VCBS repeat-containing protein [Phycisphaeraceae bacterium]|nr:MAG: VCBS repeat-containing protein [Phycisphaeraceae bacterium]